jgi:hypothetical protein
MRKRILKGAGLLVLISMFSVACEPIESCKNCEAVTYEAGSANVTGRSDAIEYCGNDLFLKENTNPVVIGSDSTVWECF